MDGSDGMFRPMMRRSGDVMPCSGRLLCLSAFRSLAHVHDSIAPQLYSTHLIAYTIQMRLFLTA